jgi:TRAP-type C4-dicarboxylate transport system substrate-binding protein
MKPTKLIIIAAAAAIFAAAGARAEVKIALDSPPDMIKSGPYVWAHTFSQALIKRGMAAREFPRGALGGEAEKLDQVSQGLIQISMSDVKSAGKINKLIFGTYLPYLFTDIAHLDRAVVQAGLLAKINAGIKKNKVRVLAFVAIGPAAGIFNTKRPVHSAADLKGLRMRALDENQIALFKAWGTTGTIVSWREVPNALQTGVADGYINPVFVPLMFGHTGFIKYFTDAQMAQAVRIVLASESWYTGLSAKDRKIVDASAAEATRTNRAWLAKVGPGMIAAAEKAGIKVVTLKPKARKEFIRLSMKVYTKGVLSAAQVKVWVDAAAKTR